MSALSTAPRAFIVSDWKPHEKNSLRGFFTITTPAGMVIRGCTLHQKANARWVGMPSQKITKDDCSTSYTPIIEFVDRSAAIKFRDGVLLAIDAAGLGGGR
jgi:hypothetical protein